MLIEVLPERDNVQVYKDAFDLLLFVYKSLGEMNRTYRFTLLEEMKRTLQELLSSIYEAKKTTPRSALLIDAMHWTYEAKVLFRMMDSLGLLKDWQFAYFVKQLTTVSKQLTAWHKYEKRNEEKKCRSLNDGI